MAEPHDLTPAERGNALAAILGRIRSTSGLRDRLFHEINDRISRGDFDDDTSSLPVQKPAPRGPLNRSGAVAIPES